MTHTNGSPARRILGLRFSGCLTAVVLATACTGQVADPDPMGAGAQPGSGGAQGAAAGQAGTTNVTPGGGTGANGGMAAGGAGGSPSTGPRDPGRVTMRRLNRAEYDNTVRDLLGTALQPGASSFLNDAPELGFDNNSDLQTVSPVQAGLYQTAAELLAAEAITAPARARLITCDLAAGEACARTVLTSLGTRAFRRPITDAEITSYLALMATAKAAGATADEAMRTAIEAVLVSPHFLFRVELDSNPTSLAAHPVSSYEMASRLSYTVYRSMPDQALFDAAAADKLTATADVQAQLVRMLADPKGKAFSQTFSEQWLGTKLLAGATFDKALFPSYTPALNASMAAEVTSFFDEFVREDRPLPELVTANFSYLDDTLAKLYGVPAVGAGAVKRTTLTSPQRGGLLSMAATLAVTSYPVRTSVVKRGAYILGQLLCAEPPPPPPDIPPFPDGPIMASSQKEVLAQHRKNPSCAACHQSMDNIGLALENYDAVGAWRTVDKGVAIDAHGVYPGTMQPFNGARELATIVSQDPRFSSCMAERMLTFALGRTVGTSDDPYVQDIAKAKSGAAVGVRELLVNVVGSDTFRMRRGEMGDKP
jgi:hypothetical protein